MASFAPIFSQWELLFLEEPLKVPYSPLWSPAFALGDEPQGEKNHPGFCYPSVGLF